MSLQSSAQVIPLPYGKGQMSLALDSSLAKWNLISPREESAVRNPEEAFRSAAANPIGSKPLKDFVKPTDRVVIVTADGTRPVPNKFLIPQILNALPVSDSQVTVLLGTGTHRPNSDEEILQMFGEEVVSRVKIVNHDGFSKEDNIALGETSDGYPIEFDRLYVEADVRIAVGFIEPHFFAGFSGGPKGIMPGIASVETIYNFHRYEMIAHPNSTFAVLDENPTQRFIREAVALCPPHFLVNVTLNSSKEITAFFLGDYIEAHVKGCEHVRQHAMVAVEKPCEVIVTTNSGFPLDQNLYQAVKALSAACRIVAEGGAIFLVSECSDGLPAHGNFGSLLSMGKSPQETLQYLQEQKKTILDQWQVQVLMNAVIKARVYLYSQLDPELVRSLGLTPVLNLQEAIEKELKSRGSDIDAAAMPMGPLTIPYLV